MKLALVLVAVLGCKAAEQAPPPASDDRPTISKAEVARGQDACKAYVDRVCACAEHHPEHEADRKSECALARALPDAMQVGLDVAMTADSTRRDVVQANDSVRKIVKQCIEQTAKLAGVCP